MSEELRAGHGDGAPVRGRGRPAPDWENPGLTEALAAYMRLMDTVVPESQYCKSTNRGDPDEQAWLGDIIERAAARARAGAQCDTSQAAGR